MPPRLMSGVVSLRLLAIVAFTPSIAESLAEVAMVYRSARQVRTQSSTMPIRCWTNETESRRLHEMLRQKLS